MLLQVGVNCFSTEEDQSYAKKSSIREFKFNVVRAAEAAELRPAQAYREYQIAKAVLNYWPVAPRAAMRARLTHATGSG